jgi:hypothetical protein
LKGVKIDLRHRRRPPCGRPIEEMPGATSNVVSLPWVGGLHHRYAWRQAA